VGDYTDIEWATHTLNWWTGCEHVSPACAHCYAEAWARRAGRDFSERRLTTEANRRKPLKWEANATEFEREHGHRQRIFVNSLSDVFDNKVPQEWRDSLFEMIRRTPSLDYLLLTKRIGNAERMLPADWGDGYPNVWLGATVANQEEAERDIPKLLAVSARVRFLSIEPMLGPLDLEYPESMFPNGPQMCCDGRECGCMGRPIDPPLLYGINWVIVGGESGSGARSFNIQWARDLVAQCRGSGTAVFVKQLGARPYLQVTRSSSVTAPSMKLHIAEMQLESTISLSDRKGGDIREWPEDLRVRQFPDQVQS
jgi:protein gp37